MYTFELLQLKKVPSVKDWYLKLSSIKELCEYHEITIPNIIESATMNLIMKLF